MHRNLGVDIFVNSSLVDIGFELIPDIRTYAVMPLNEECGLLEWVSNTAGFKHILEKGYARYGKKTYVRDSSSPSA